MKDVLLTKSQARATIGDVARAAGVSKTTVSQVLNGKGRASEDTRALVLEVATRIGYGANPIARSLRTGRTGVLGIVFRPSDAISGSLMGTEFHIRVAGGAATSALNLGYGLLHLPDPLSANDSGYPMDGCVVVAPYGGDQVIDELNHRGIPVVSVDPDPDRLERNMFVGRDEMAATEELLNHIWQMGARSPVLLSITDNNAWKRGFDSTYRAWCDSNGLEADLIELPGASGSDGAYKHIRQILNLGSRPDVIIAATSRFAVGAAKAATQAGLTVPQDIMIAALSDSELTRSHIPPISALDLHGDIVGKEAVEKLVQFLEGASPAPYTRIRPTLRLRQSTVRNIK
ncbi:LacI family DNA-binding transcriptional regulator [Alcaligenes nematophilus]|uniref:LacI family DNA-binding transcriptional regulator n=1 Tax=Alcaligenes nematophilus TaxID=2994643 RepID=UPI00246455E4|nr:LacI family DNA-binding transcriptional regulator [Alcaligenes nematophilus]MDH4865413.1 LacI family DNA-binding transcriptional regulator [Bacillus cereus]MDY7126712.1 LacI family DNA-binding transcriptional regulator [Alcaligenes nematophilus]